MFFVIDISFSDIYFLNLVMQVFVKQSMKFFSTVKEATVSLVSFPLSSENPSITNYQKIQFLSPPQSLDNNSSKTLENFV